MEMEPSMRQNPSSFLNTNVEKYFNELQGKTFIQERGFAPSMILCKEIWPLVRNTEGHMWDIVPVRGKEVQVTPQIICDFYNAPYYEKDFIDETNLEYFWDISMDNIINFLMLIPFTQWMQESEPIFQAFARQNNILVPGYTLDMFGPTNLEQEEEMHEREEEGEDEKDDRSEEMDFEEGD
ncbi:hypothetical protein Goklo_025194 [Gossypium klotzschianum]|uniref:Uncharacterized protein n=1 Tax=Gossypium klotzschianum TaxID=34286 RepID=A0A7J8W756_9ROSI|nr:hypothetical protein [Gossypium klotzschianum]